VCFCLAVITGLMVGSCGWPIVIKACSMIWVKHGFP
jgi:hypothetical protein